MPGYTHLKRAEPVTFGHWCLAYVEMLSRDAARLASAARARRRMPSRIGGARRHSPSDRPRGARRRSRIRARQRELARRGLGPRRRRGLPLRRGAPPRAPLADGRGPDLLLVGRGGIRRAAGRLATGSSRMPQKKNPDLLELVRGHAGRSIGELTGFLALLKGLPLAYDKDLQLDKEPLFRTRDVLRASLPALAALVGDARLNRGADACGRRGAIRSWRRSWRTRSPRAASRSAKRTTIVGRRVGAAAAEGREHRSRCRRRTGSRRRTFATRRSRRSSRRRARSAERRRRE